MKIPPGARFRLVAAQLLFVLSLPSSSSSPCFTDPSSVSDHRVITDGQTLQEAAGAISSKTLITINSSQVIISSPVEFSHLSGITINGQGATITCSSAEGGLVFRNMQQLCLTNFTLSNCSMWSNISEVKSSLPTTTTTSARVAILIISGTSLTVMSVQVTNNTGTGLAILDTAGNVTIKRSLFAYNKVEEFQFGWSGGLHIQLSGNNEYSSITHQARQSKNKLNSTYTVTHCHFSGNKAYSKSAEQDENFGGQGGGGGGGRGGGGGGGGGGGRGGGRGGGLAVVLDEGTTGNHFYISQSTFDGNIAANDGGGLSILLTGNITNNTISITGSNFSSNLCQSNRGGGASVTWDSSGKQKPLYNMVCFMSCFFVRNRASFGGGVAVLDIRGGYDMSTNTLEFRDTRWERNKAWFGAAVDIRPDVLWYKNTDCYQPTFAFSGCTITENVVITESDLAGAGAMRVSKHHVTFSQFMEFTNNNGSAFILRDSVLKIISGCRLSFNTNNGTVGGAMRLQESSWVTIEGHNGTVEMQFHNNTALYIGGAIVIYTSNTQEVKFSQACFLQCLNKQEIKMHFRGNFAGINDHAAISNLSYPIRVTSDGSGFGDIIFATTLNPCMKVCHGYSVEENDYDYLNYTCNQCFITLNVSKPTNELDAHRASTSALYIDFPGDGPIKLIPGKETHLNLTTYDDLDQLIRTSYRATVTEGSSSITLDRQYGQMSNSSLILYGFPNSKGTVRLEASGVLGLTKFIDVELDNCPPGYVVEESKQGPACVCGTGTNPATKQRYYASILYCRNSLFRAKLDVGMWAGYLQYNNITNASYENFRTVTCPLGYCNTTESVYLPSQASAEDLERLICVASRKGTLCADCISNMTTSFHSKSFICVSVKLCRWGLLFYLLTELLPLTILFLVVTCFSINFSKGGLSSFILFAQIQPQLIFSQANPYVFNHSQFLTFLYNCYNVIYGVFNLEFFTIDPLAFCLWDGANPLDMLAIQYVSTIYALLLVMGLVVFFNHCSCCLCWRRLMLWRRSKGLSVSVVHGIIAFLTLCYAQCVTVTIQILTTSYVQGFGGATGEVWVYYYARLKYFSSQHLIYAIPALAFLLTFVIIPPLLLMSYPVCYQVMSLCHVSETRVGRGLTRWIEKLKPVLDAFQSCFRDRFRFTAGLYFLYRAVVPTVYVVVDNTLAFYTTLEVLFIIALLFHAIAQPYHRMRNNIYHALVMANLALITGLYMYNYTGSQQAFRDYDRELQVAGMIMVLIYLPVVCGIGYITITYGRRQWSSVLKKLGKLKKRRTNHGRQQSIESDEELPARLLQEEVCDYLSCEYADSSLVYVR